MGFEKKCECSGKMFETKRYPTKYCSQACYRKMQRTAVNKRKMKLMKQEYKDVVVSEERPAPSNEFQHGRPRPD